MMRTIATSTFRKLTNTMTEIEENWWDDRTMPNDDGPDWERDANGVLWQVDPKTGQRIRWEEKHD